MQSVCAWCEREHGVPRRRMGEGPRVTHGMCRRHFLQQMSALGMSPDAEGTLASMSDASFCPDLGPVPAKACGVLSGRRI
jgi:hypothetical protein